MFRHAHLLGALALAGAGLLATGCASEEVVVAKPVPVAVVTPAKAPQPVAVNEKLSLPLDNGCRYDAVVRGSIAPVHAVSSSGESLVSPNLAVTADVACPNETVVRATRNVVTPGPMTHAQLEQELETRAMVATSATGQSCYYTPDFTIAQNQIVANGVATLCTAPQQLQQ